MPKEIIHWVVAKKAAVRAPAPRLTRIIENNMSLYLMGAFAVDSPYYVVMGEDKPLFAKAGARLHGMGGESPFAAVLTVPSMAMGVDEDRAMAFTLGALTHVIADTVFHPMIYYLTGDYHDADEARREKAVIRHRLLETWLDIWFAKKEAFENRRGIFRFAAHDAREAKCLAPLGSALFFGERDMSSPARMALLSHAIIQSLFNKRWIARLTGFYGRLTHRDMDEFTSLFYPPAAAEPPSFFSEPIRYKNPVSGEVSQESLADMEKRAVETCAGWFDAISKSSGSTRLMEACGHLSGAVPPGGFTPVHFAPEREMDELLKTLSVFRTAR